VKSPKVLISLLIGEFITTNPYGGFDWYAILGVQNKQGEIRVMHRKF
jgi:hypothetical protein